MLQRAALREAEKQAQAAAEAAIQQQASHLDKHQRQMDLLALQQRDAGLADRRREETVKAREKEGLRRARRMEQLALTVRPASVAVLSRSATRLTQPTQVHISLSSHLVILYT